MNVNLLPCSKILIDSNIIIYYIISSEEIVDGKKIHLKIGEFTDKSHKIIKDLSEEGKIFFTPQLIFNEIKIAKRVDHYCNTDFKVLLKKDNINDKTRLKLIKSAQRKLRRLKYKPWFEIINYVPEKEDIENVKNFYISLEKTEEMKEHMKRKFRFDPWPSYEDMALLCCSKEEQSPFVTNDTDFTRFIDKLVDEKLCYQLINLSEYR